MSANSLVDFSFDLLELDESGALYPIDGLPVQGFFSFMVLYSDPGVCVKHCMYLFPSHVKTRFGRHVGPGVSL